MLICADVDCPKGALLRMHFIDFPTEGNLGTRGQTPVPLLTFLEEWNVQTDQATKCNNTLYAHVTTHVHWPYGSYG